MNAKMAALWALSALLLLVGLLLFSSWMGRAVAHPGEWLAVDHAVYRTLNAHIDRPHAGFLFTALNHPGLDYLVLIALILGYCARRRLGGVALAAACIGVTLTMNVVATWEIQRSPARERPFLHVSGARTAIQSCHGPILIGSRGQQDTIAACDETDAPPGARRGLDWQTIWVHYPSFPSGHLRETAALCTLLAAFWPAARLFAVALVLVMGYTRVVVGAHYPSDVLGGALIGFWSGTVTLAGLVAARHADALLRRAPAVQATWDYVARPRHVGRPDLDPLPARAVRVALAVAGANAIVVVAGVVGGTAWASNVLELLSDSQQWVATRLPVRSASLAPGFLLAGSAAAALLAASRREERWAAPARATLVVLVVAATLSGQLLWMGGALFAHTEQAAVWGTRTTFPAPHALFAAALVSAVPVRSLQAAAPGKALAALTAIASSLVSAASVHASLVGYVAGAAVGTLARSVVAQFTPLPASDLHQERPTTASGDSNPLDPSDDETSPPAERRRATPATVGADVGATA